MIWPPTGVNQPSKRRVGVPAADGRRLGLCMEEPGVGEARGGHRGVNRCAGAERRAREATETFPESERARERER